MKYYGSEMPHLWYKIYLCLVLFTQKEYLEQSRKIGNELNVDYGDNLNICGFHHFKDDSSLEKDY